MSSGEEERAGTVFEFSSGFSVVVLTCLSLVSSSKLSIWCETFFRSPPLNGLDNFRLSLNLRGWCSTRVYTSSSTAAHSFSNPNCHLTSVWCRREQHPFPLLQHLLRKCVASIFSKSFLMTVFISPWLANLQQVLTPESLRGQLPTSVDSLLFLIIFLLSLLSKKITLSL